MFHCCTSQDIKNWCRWHRWKQKSVRKKNSFSRSVMACNMRAMKGYCTMILFDIFLRVFFSRYIRRNEKHDGWRKSKIFTVWESETLNFSFCECKNREKKLLRKSNLKLSWFNWICGSSEGTFFNWKNFLLILKGIYIIYFHFFEGWKKL